MGAVSPLGNDVESSWQAAIAGKSGAGVVTHFDPSQFETRIGADPCARYDPA